MERFLSDADELRARQKRLQDVLEVLEESSQQISQPGVVQLSSMALVPGVFVHTNEVFCPALPGSTEPECWLTVPQAKQRILTALCTLDAEIEDRVEILAEEMQSPRDSLFSLLPAPSFVPAIDARVSTSTTVDDPPSVREINIGGEVFTEIVEAFSEDSLSDRHRAILSARRAGSRRSMPASSSGSNQSDPLPGGPAGATIGELPMAAASSATIRATQASHVPASTPILSAAFSRAIVERTGSALEPVHSGIGTASLPLGTTPRSSTGHHDDTQPISRFRQARLTARTGTAT